ncbi:peptidyl-prolyl isomerase CWC27 [Tirmania nivea]|nr:peptidyl-prolyl isomerase CWC27 [Tirmania nivea]
MSSAYTLEPQTTAKVLMHTTSGDLELELWATQCPLTCRNFLQLCLDNYYDNTIFHRLVPGFIVQGGDPTGTGYGGEAIYPGGLFSDEFHSRLKFNRRGLLGMANSGKPDDNGSQFFLTLGDTKELTGKNTLFGKVVGETIYNLVKIGEMELEEEGSEKMLYPVKITGAEVLVNPFEDMVKRETRKEVVGNEIPKKTVAGKKKGGGKKGKALLSFGGEEEEGEPMVQVKKTKFDTRLVSAIPEEKEIKASPLKPRPAPKEPEARSRKSPSSSSRSPSPAPRKLSPPATKLAKSTLVAIPSRSPSPEPMRVTDSFLTKTNAQIEALKSTLKRGGAEPPSSAPTSKKRSLLALQKEMLPSTSVKGRKRKRNGKGKGGTGDVDDVDATDTLERFKLKLARAAQSTDDRGDISLQEKAEAPNTHAVATPAPTADDGEEEYQLCDLHFIPHCQSCKSWDDAYAKNANANAINDEDVSSENFLGHTLRFEKDRLGKDLNWKMKHDYDDGLVVIDPLEKGRELAEQARGTGRGGRGGGSGSGSWGRDWDRDRGRDRNRDRRGGLKGR